MTNAAGNVREASDPSQKLSMIEGFGSALGSVRRFSFLTKSAFGCLSLS